VVRLGAHLREKNVCVVVCVSLCVCDLGFWNATVSGVYIESGKLEE